MWKTVNMVVTHRSFRHDVVKFAIVSIQQTGLTVEHDAAQAMIPFSEDELEYIARLDAEADMDLLRRELPSLREESLRTLQVATILLQRCAAAGASPYHQPSSPCLLAPHVRSAVVVAVSVLELLEEGRPMSDRGTSI